MELYIIRHGQTDWNKEGRLQGNVDIELNENGREMAAAAGKRLDSVYFDKIYSSPLKRAYETATLIRNNRDIPLLVDDNLREINFGAGEGRTYDEWNQPGSATSYFFSDNENNKYIPPEGGETLESVCHRTKDFVQKVIEPQCDSCQRIMIVAHGALLAAMKCYLDNHSYSNFWGDGLPQNCQQTVYSFTSDTRTWKRV